MKAQLIKECGMRVSSALSRCISANLGRSFKYLVIVGILVPSAWLYAKAEDDGWNYAGSSIYWKASSTGSLNCSIQLRNESYSVRTLYPEATYINLNYDRKTEKFGEPGISDDWIVVGSKAGNNIARAVILSCRDVRDISILKSE